MYGLTNAEAIGNLVQSFRKTQFPVSFDQYMSALRSEGRWEGELIHTTKRPSYYRPQPQALGGMAPEMP